MSSGSASAVSLASNSSAGNGRQALHRVMSASAALVEFSPDFTRESPGIVGHYASLFVYDKILMDWSLFLRISELDIRRKHISKKVARRVIFCKPH